MSSLIRYLDQGLPIDLEDGGHSTPSGCRRGLSGQAMCLTLSLVVGDLQVFGGVSMVGSVVHAKHRLTSSC
jgi:hypothetical protein